MSKKGKGEAAGKAPKPAGKPASFSPIDRAGLLGLLDQVVNSGQSGVLELREPRGNWLYAFQAGALTHASGGRVRGARQAFDLLWEFQSGEFTFTPGPNPSLAGNLYIDKGRLLDLLRRSQAVLQGPAAPYIPPGQQRPVAPVNQPYMPPAPSQMPPAWQPGAMPGQYPMAPPQGPPQAWPAPPAPGYGAPGYPQQQGYPAAPYPGAPYPAAPGPYPAQAYPQAPEVMQTPAGAPPQPGYPMPPQMMPPQAMPPQVMPPLLRPRPVTPPSFSVPPMPIPRKREAVPSYQPPAAAPPVAEPATAVPPADDLSSLRASLVAQAPPVRPVPTGPAWGVRTAEGTVAPAPVADVKGRGRAGSKTKGDSKLKAAVKVRLIKFLLWACERKYSADDHWTLKDAFEVSTMELRDQFIGAFSQTLKAQKKSGTDDDDLDDMAAGRMRGRGRRR
jgi:hypothetical protein